jgi:hypothetical protein
MDSRFLAGCLTIALLSLMFWAMLVWPFFAFPVHLKAGLLQALYFGGLPSMAVGALLVRKMGLEAATAFAGGSFAGGVFVYLHLANLSLGKYGDTQELPAPDYPDSWAWLVPIAWCLAVAAAVFILLPKRETEDEVGAGTDRQ